MTILCNQCGESCESPHHPAMEADTDEDRAYGLVNAKVRGHYGSHALQDLTEYTFSLCEICLRDLFANFAVPVREEEYLIGEPLTEEEKRELAEHLNSPPQKLSRSIMANAIWACPELDNRDDAAEIYLSQVVWDELQGSDLLELSTDRRSDQPWGYLYGTAVYVDESLVGLTIRVRSLVIDLAKDVSG